MLLCCQGLQRSDLPHRGDSSPGRSRVPPLSRRRAVQALGATITEAALHRAPAASAAAGALPGARRYAGTDLAGWQVLVGDAARVGQPAVEQADIETLHFSSHSDVRANIRSRADVMVHNLTFEKFIDPRAFDYIHICQYQFRVPYMPTTANTTQNAQTIEGNIQLWDGQVRQRMHTVAFQWVINPFAGNAGAVQCWTGRGWQEVWSLPIDTAWHTMRMLLDPRHEACDLTLDGVHIPSCYVIEPKANFGADISAALAAEAVSIDPGALYTGGKQHTAQFRDWSWEWEPAAIYQVALPLAAQPQR
jgi:hypothetical protein